MAVLIKILPNDFGQPPDKLADVELHFTGGTLDGMKLVGLTIWKGPGVPRVTMPSRDYTVDGKRQAYSLLRPIKDDVARARLINVVLEAWQAFKDSEAWGKV